MTTSENTPSYEQIVSIPKVLLHDHLDGGLRPATIIELAAAIGYDLPETEPEPLAAWFVEAANSGSLVRYLETFDHTVAVMQTAQALERVAFEAVVDLAADGVVYAEQRWAPEQHVQAGLSLQDAVEAVGRGLAAGEAEVAAQGGQILARQLITAMRHAERSPEIAELALANRGQHGVVGFDIAGAELGFGPELHSDAFDELSKNLFPVTIHAGEADGIDSIAGALHTGRARRLGHGVRLADDLTGVDVAMTRRSKADLSDVGIGPIAQWVLDRRIPLELCPSSNVQTGAATSVRNHPISLFKNLGFAVTVNTDNRLMSGTSMSREMFLLASEADWTFNDLLAVTLTAAWNAFIPFQERRLLVEQLILPRVNKIREDR